MFADIPFCESLYAHMSLSVLLNQLLPLLNADMGQHGSRRFGRGLADDRSAAELAEDMQQEQQ